MVSFAQEEAVENIDADVLNLSLEEQSCQETSKKRKGNKDKEKTNSKAPRPDRAKKAVFKNRQQKKL